MMLQWKYCDAKERSSMVELRRQMIYFVWWFDINTVHLTSMTATSASGRCLQLPLCTFKDAVQPILSWFFFNGHRVNGNYKSPATPALGRRGRTTLLDVRGGKCSCRKWDN